MNNLELKTRMIYRLIIAVLVSGLLLVILIFLVILPLVEKSGKLAYLDVLVTPASARVEIGDVEYHNAVYELEPGVYQATVIYEGVEPKIVELDLIKNQTTGLYLRLDDDDWRQFTKEEMIHKNNLAGETPIYFSICGTPAKRTNCDALAIVYDRAKECDYDRCVIISGRSVNLSDEALDEARNQLAEKGYSLSDYQYTYIQNDNR